MAAHAVQRLGGTIEMAVMGTKWATVVETDAVAVVAADVVNR
jgi:hypothetical protein